MFYVSPVSRKWRKSQEWRREEPTIHDPDQCHWCNCTTSAAGWSVQTQPQVILQTKVSLILIYKPIVIIIIVMMDAPGRKNWCYFCRNYAIMVITRRAQNDPRAVESLFGPSEHILFTLCFLKRYFKNPPDEQEMRKTANASLVAGPIFRLMV